ncbi:MAG: oligosaccharide flippase family protein, partial [Salinisphaera sp.]|nr:oligosaccharide flippase family protein [Salinisphaera sp.]
LAWQVVTGPALRSAGFWAVAGWRPALRWRRREAGELLRFGAPLLGSYLLGYSQRNTDNLIIGSVQGAAALGYYSRAYALMLMPLTHITYIMQNVMLASFSRLRRNRRAVRMAYLRAIGVLALITMPMMAGLLATAHAFVLTMFGGQWAAMVPILQLLCVVGLIQPITATSGWLFLSQGRTDLQMRISLLTTPLVVAAFAVGVLWGALGVAAAYAIVNLVIWYPIMAWSGRLVGLEIRGLLRQLRGPLLSSLTMAAAVAWVARWLPADWAAPARLALLVLSGIACYTALAGLLQRRALSDLLELLRPRRRAERTTPSD